jgi:catalase
MRRRRAKNICVADWFESAGKAVKLSRAGERGHIPLVGGLALAGGMPFRTEAPASVRGMAVRFLPSGEDEWQTGTIAVNAARGSTGPVLTTALDAATGKPDPAKVQAFLAAHPEVRRALAIIAKRRESSGPADTGLNTFRFVDAAGQTIPVSRSTVAVQPFEPAGPAVRADQVALFDDVLDLAARHPSPWELLGSAGAPGDPTDDTTVAWPGDRGRIDTGSVSFDRGETDHVQIGESLPCTTVNLDPTESARGIEPAGDPELSAQSSAFARSLSLRSRAHDEKPATVVGPNSSSSGSEGPS